VRSYFHIAASELPLAVFFENLGNVWTAEL